MVQTNFKKIMAFKMRRSTSHEGVGGLRRVLVRHARGGGGGRGGLDPPPESEIPYPD